MSSDRSPDTPPRRVSASALAKRNAEVAASRALGLTWAEVARKHGISDRTARTAVKDHAEAEKVAAEVGGPANLDAERLFFAAARAAKADNDSAWSGCNARA